MDDKILLEEYLLEAKIPKPNTSQRDTEKQPSSLLDGPIATPFYAHHPSF